MPGCLGLAHDFSCRLVVLVGQPCRALHTGATNNNTVDCSAAAACSHDGTCWMCRCLLSCLGQYRISDLANVFGTRVRADVSLMAHFSTHATCVCKPTCCLPPLQHCSQLCVAMWRQPATLYSALHCSVESCASGSVGQVYVLSWCHMVAWTPAVCVVPAHFQGTPAVDAHALKLPGWKTDDGMPSCLQCWLFADTIVMLSQTSVRHTDSSRSIAYSPLVWSCLSAVAAKMDPWRDNGCCFNLLRHVRLSWPHQVQCLC